MDFLPYYDFFFIYSIYSLVVAYIELQQCIEEKVQQTNKKNIFQLQRSIIFKVYWILHLLVIFSYQI